MALRIACFCLLVVGGVAMVITTWRYHCFLRQNRSESYEQVGPSRRLEVLAQVVMFFFIFGFAVGATDILIHDVQPIFLFVAIVFFIGSMFIFAMVQVQIAMADSLREKTMDVMRSFVNSIEMKDPYTQGHSWHVYHIVRLFCRKLPPKMRGAVNEAKLLDAALLHDIGKMGVPDEILKKRGPLTDEEWVAIKGHPRLGKQMLAGTCYEEISDWVLYHHERMDGAGYHGLAGAAIPLEARIIAVADTYSAMTTDREYRPKRDHATAMEIMRQVSGTQLDGELVEIFATLSRVQLEELQEEVRRERSGAQAAAKGS